MKREEKMIIIMFKNGSPHKKVEIPHIQMILTNGLYKTKYKLIKKFI